jgi:hypothetical protein
VRAGATASEQPSRKRTADGKEPARKRASAAWHDPHARLPLDELAVPLTTSEVKMATRYASAIDLEQLRLTQRNGYTRMIGIEAETTLMTVRHEATAALRADGTQWPVFVLCIAGAGDDPAVFPAVPCTIVAPDRYQMVTARRRSDNRALTIFYCTAQFKFEALVGSLPWTAQLKWTDD